MNPPRVLQSEWKYIRFYTGILVLLRCGKGSEAKTCAQPEMLEQTTMGAFDYNQRMHTKEKIKQ